MALELALVRHGEATGGRAGIKDIDRTLTFNGIVGSLQVASKLLQEGFNPDAIYTSPAARAMHTSLIFTRTLEKKSSLIQISDDLYYGSSDSINEWITETLTGVKSIILFGHNPGVTDVVATLSQGRSSFMPPAGVAWFTFDTDSWSNIRKANLAAFRFFAPSGGGE